MARQDKRKLKQVFSFHAPDALSVMLAGDFTDWQRKPINLEKQANGMWQATVALPAGVYHYRFLVDGEWRDDPECTLRVANPYGSHNAVVMIPPAPGRESVSKPKVSRPG